MSKTHSIDLYGSDLRAIRDRQKFEERGLGDVYDELTALKESVSNLASSVANISAGLADLSDQMADTSDWRRDVNAVFNRLDWTEADA